MANPSKAKGTAEETRIVRKWNDWFGREVARRMPASALYDIDVRAGECKSPAIEVLATRADRGPCLYTIREEDFIFLFMPWSATNPVHIESKRYARFSLHTIFNAKFGRTHAA